LRILDSGHVAMGDEAQTLESEVAARLQQPFAAALDSGASALMLAVHALKGGRDKFMVGIPAYACSAVLHAVRAAGATPVCMDCADDLRLDRKRALAVADGLNAVVLVHPFGLVETLVTESWPCPVIEDIAQSAGGCLDGRPLGGFGDVVVASFYATKPWGGAMGGMVLSRDEGLNSEVLAMRNADSANVHPVYAGNHQLSDMHAAMARARLAIADKEREERMKFADEFDNWFEGKEARPVMRLPEGNHYRYIVRTKGCAASVIEALRARGVKACRPVQAPLSMQLGDTGCKGAEQAWRDCVSLPLLADFSDAELDQMQQAVRTCL